MSLHLVTQTQKYSTKEYVKLQKKLEKFINVIFNSPCKYILFLSFFALCYKQEKILTKTSSCVNYKANQGEESISRFVLTIIIDMSVLIYCGVPCNVANYYMLINHCTCYPICLGFITPCRAKVRLINNVQLISG